uniref:USP domain-containing protein n=1 Tax=Meloidogyne floridensis TaxID=298350 RepID=A0A915NHN8_9BILA
MAYLKVYIFKNNLFKGHYTAAAHNLIDGKWRLFNDNGVSDKSKHEISESNCSYMLFYQRRPSVPWFPHKVPYDIIQEYREIYRDAQDYKQRNKSKRQNKYSR